MMHEFDAVALVRPLPADRLFPSELPHGEGLVPGDIGAIVDAAHAPAIYTVEFFRDGETVAIADVRPEEMVVAPVLNNSPAAVSDTND